MTSNLRYQAPLLAACLLSLPAAGLILFSVSQLQMGTQDAYTGIAIMFLHPEPGVTHWHLRLLICCGPFCSLFISGYALCYPPRQERRWLSSTASTAGGGCTWVATAFMNLFLLVTFFMYQ